MGDVSAAIFQIVGQSEAGLAQIAHKLGFSLPDVLRQFALTMGIRSPVAEKDVHCFMESGFQAVVGNRTDSNDAALGKRVALGVSV